MSTAASPLPNGTSHPEGPTSASSAILAKKGLKLKQSVKLKESGADKLDVWSIFTPANMPPDAINLGQGFMNWAPPQYVRDAASKAMNTDVMANHYSHPRGRPRLLKAISKHYSSQFPNIVKEGRDLATDEIVVTAGANEGMFAALLAFLEPGDEVLVIEPFFDQYLPSIIFNGGVPVYVPLHPPTQTEGRTTGRDWTLDMKELEAAFTDKTKVLILNTPQNPTGVCFDSEQLGAIAKMCIEHNVLVLSDEVYDCMTYDGIKHERIASLPGMWERTLTVGSGGKSWSSTGWRVGWLIGSPELTIAVLQASTRIIFCAQGVAQEAIAAGFEEAAEREFFPTQAREYQERRDTICTYFDQLGLPYTLPDGAYFVLVDMSKVTVPEGFSYPDNVLGRGADYKKCWWMAQTLKVVSIPPSSFYSKEHEAIGEKFARFAFCKDLDTLHAAGKRLLGLKEYM